MNPESEEALFKIRPAARGDLEALYALDPIARSGPQRRKMLRRAVTAGECHLAVKNRILGFAILEYSFYENGFISLLVVHPQERRQGVSLALMKYLESLCQTETLFISTNESNLPMQALLAKLEYQPSGIIYGLDEGDPELVFRKQVKDPNSQIKKP